MFKKLKEMIHGSDDEELIAKILDSSEPDLRSIGLFAELEAEKIAEISHALLYLNEIGRNCRVMIHSVMGGNAGSLHDMMNEMDAIENLQQMYIDCLVTETKLTESKIKKMLERKVNIYLSAEEAVEYGIADHIV